MNREDVIPGTKVIVSHRDSIWMNEKISRFAKSNYPFEIVGLSRGDLVEVLFDDISFWVSFKNLKLF